MIRNGFCAFIFTYANFDNLFGNWIFNLLYCNVFCGSKKSNFVVIFAAPVF